MKSGVEKQQKLKTEKKAQANDSKLKLLLTMKLQEHQGKAFKEVSNS